MIVLSFSERGCVRKNNEDSFLVLPEYGFCAVADGMGGHLAGEVASSTSVEELKKLIPGLDGLTGRNLEKGLIDIFQKINRVVYNTSIMEPEKAGMGTTLSALLIRDNTAAIAHVGDSRVYLWRNQELKLLTVDHSLVEELLRLDKITHAEAENHPQRHILMRAVGTSRELSVDCQSIKVLPGDVFFLCTDGVSNVVSDQEVAVHFLKPDSWEDRFAKLRRIILKRGAPDNFTALCCILE